MSEISESLIKYLDEHKFEFFTQWKETVLNEEYHYKNNAIENGIKIYELVKKSIIHLSPDEEIKDLAYKVAKERLEANINIGEFVYNVNLGRSLLIKFVNRSGIPFEKLQLIVDTINSQFDKFCYHAVSKYIELKNIELQEKMLFINQTHKDKMTLLGQMSSSFVHEFRNPLTSVIGFMKLLKDENPDLKYIDTIENELDQLKFRITQFLHVSKLDVVEKKKEMVSFHVLFDEMLKFLYPSIVDGDVVITTEVDDVTLNVYKDEVKQVFLNLILNSIDALQLKENQREITIVCKENGGYITFIVSNNGPAIDPEVKRIIFEPFFTTKKLGTGIGLFVCKEIVEKHNGTISCESDENQTSFIIDLPIG